MIFCSFFCLEPLKSGVCLEHQLHLKCAQAQMACGSRIGSCSSRRVPDGGRESAAAPDVVSPTTAFTGQRLSSHTSQDVLVCSPQLPNRLRLGHVVSLGCKKGCCRVWLFHPLWDGCKEAGSWGKLRKQATAPASLQVVNTCVRPLPRAWAWPVTNSSWNSTPKAKCNLRVLLNTRLQAVTSPCLLA